MIKDERPKVFQLLPFDKSILKGLTSLLLISISASYGANQGFTSLIQYFPAKNSVFKGVVPILFLSTYK